MLGISFREPYCDLVRDLARRPPPSVRNVLGHHFRQSSDPLGSGFEIEREARGGRRSSLYGIRELNEHPVWYGGGGSNS